MQDSEFIDYYQLLQISPAAELETIQRVFRLLADRYHPDNPHTGDAGRFLRVTGAYEILSNRPASPECGLSGWNRSASQPIGYACTSESVSCSAPYLPSVVMLILSDFA